MYFIHTEHARYTVRADSDTRGVILIPNQSFYGPSMHLLACKSLSTHAVPKYQATILCGAKTPLSHRIEAQVCQCVPPMDVFGIQYIVQLERCSISYVYCPVVSTSGQYQLTIGHFLPVYWCHSCSVTSKGFNLLPWKTWQNTIYYILKLTSCLFHAALH